MIDDGWAAAAAWDERLRTADEIIARADSRQPRRRAAAAVGDRRATFRMQVAGAARVQVKQLKPKPYTVDRSEALPLLERFLAGAPNVEVVWLSDGVDLGKGAAFIDGPQTDHRRPPAHRRQRRPRRPRMRSPPPTTPPAR